MFLRAIFAALILSVSACAYVYRNASAAGDHVTFSVKDVDAKQVTILPMIAPLFGVLAEGATPTKGDVLNCKARGKKMGQQGNTAFVVTELDCGKQGKFLVEKVYFATE